MRSDFVFRSLDLDSKGIDKLKKGFLVQNRKTWVLIILPLGSRREMLSTGISEGWAVARCTVISGANEQIDVNWTVGKVVRG